MVSSGYGISVAGAAILAMLLRAAAHLYRTMDLHDKHFVRKRLTRLRDIRSNATNPEFTRYLDGAIELEMFRIASGVSTSRLKMEYLLQLDRSGRWSRFQLRSLSKFLAIEPGRETPYLSVSVLDRISAWASGSSVSVPQIHVQL